MKSIFSALLSTFAPFIFMLGIVYSPCLAQDAPPELAALTKASTAKDAEAGYAEALDYLLPMLDTGEQDKVTTSWNTLLRLTSVASAPGAEANRSNYAKEIATRLASDELSENQRYRLVRQLEHVGQAESVDPLLAVIERAEPGSAIQLSALRALEKNNAAEAGKALTDLLSQDAVAKNHNAQAAVVRALGVRKEASAVEPLAKLMAAKNDSSLSPIAVAALGQIGTPAAQDWLLQAVKENEGMAQHTAAATLLDSLGATGGSDEMYGTLLSMTSLNSANRVGALLGATRDADPEKFASAVDVALNSGDAKLVSAGLQALAGSASPKMLTKLHSVPNMSEADKVKTLSIMGDHAHPAAQPHLITAVANAPEEAVRAAAAKSLSNFGNADSVKVLLNLIATHTRGDDYTAGFNALKSMGGNAIESTLVDGAKAGGEDTQVQALKVIAERGLVNGNEALLDLAKDSNDKIRRSAFNALGKIANADDLPVLLDLFKTENAADRAIQVAANRASDKAKVSNTLIDALDAMPTTKHKGRLLSALAVAGDPVGLKAVTEKVETDDLKDAAIRALSEWKSADAAQPLMDIAAANKDNLKNQVLAMRGLSRLLEKDPKVDTDVKAKLAGKALAMSGRVEEKRLFLPVLGKLPSQVSSDLLGDMLEDEDISPELKEEVAMAGVKLCETFDRARQKSKGKKLAQQIVALNLSEKLTDQAEKYAK